MKIRITVALILSAVVSISVYYVYFEATQVHVLDVTSGNNKLAIDFYKQISDGNENIFFSPPSLYVALVAMYDGAGGETAAQIQRLLSLETDRKVRHDAISRILDTNPDDPALDIKSASSLWLPDGISASSSYVSTVRDVYDMDVGSSDMSTEDAISAWATEMSAGRITKAVEFEDPDSAIVASVAHFEGQWLLYLYPDGTGSWRAVGTKSFEKMNTRHYADYASLADVTLLRMPYVGEKLSMLVIKPNNHNDIRFIEESLTVEMIEMWEAKMQRSDVDILLPKFKIESEYNLEESLAELGVTDIFDPSADLTGITGGRNLHVSDIFQKVFIDVKEPVEIDQRVQQLGIFTEDLPDHGFHGGSPFIFIIKDDSTGMFMFMGRVMDPTT